MLDFVPNHMALDHPWVEMHPEYFVTASEAELAHAPQNYTRIGPEHGNRVFAHGRDPYFDGWPDTLQLNYGNPALQEAMIAELKRIAGQCDGVRCDMAMLVLPDVFERTWGIATRPFWPQAIPMVRDRFPDFCFMAEVYWDMEWTLQQQGFVYTYDKRLYDRLHEGHARPVREHLLAGLDFQNKLARFLENHDEPRAASAFPPGVHEAAAAITYLTPGLRFFHQGQLEGRKVRIATHLCRGPDEPVDPGLDAFYQNLLSALRNPVFREGHWELLECSPAWEGNWTWERGIAFWWQGTDEQHILVVVNYAANQSQFYVRMPFPELEDRLWRLQDLLSPACFDRAGKDLESRGLFLDLPPWRYHVFQVTNGP
jgi:glycosidase